MRKKTPTKEETLEDRWYIRIPQDNVLEIHAYGYKPKKIGSLEYPNLYHIYFIVGKGLVSGLGLPIEPICSLVCFFDEWT